MKALVHNGARDVSVSEVEDPKIELPGDVIVKLTTTNVCRSDLHMYEGRTEMEEGRVLGHENLGEIVEVGKGVERVKQGDLVCLPFNIGCGHCKNCEHGLTGYCLTANPGTAGAAYGFAGMGPYEGGQAEFLRVPFADFNCLSLPEDAKERENDYVMLSDIFPTGWHATGARGRTAGRLGRRLRRRPGWSARGLLGGAEERVEGDARRPPARPAEAGRAVRRDRDRRLEAFAGRPDPRADRWRGRGSRLRVRRLPGTRPRGPRGAELDDEQPRRVGEATGSIGVVGVFVPEDPGAEDELEQEGKLAFDFGEFWFKGQRMATGQCNVKTYNRNLCALIEAGKAKPSFLVSRELPLAEAPDAYKHFDDRDEGWTKVVLKPAA